MTIQEIRNNSVNELIKLTESLKHGLRIAEELNIHESKHIIYEAIRQMQILLIDMKNEIELMEYDDDDEDE